MGLATVSAAAQADPDPWGGPGGRGIGLQPGEKSEPQGAGTSMLSKAGKGLNKILPCPNKTKMLINSYIKEEDGRVSCVELYMWSLNFSAI